MDGKWFRRYLACLVLSLAMADLAAIAPGAGAASGGGFVVSPAFEELQIDQNQPQAEYTLQLENRNSIDQTFLLQVVDFGSLDESGGVAFLGQPSSELEHKYGLASWMSLEKNTVFVRAGQTAGVLVSIENRQSLAPGGHYGAVLATAVSDPGNPPGDNVGVKQVLSSLVLVAKSGGAVGDLRLVSQTADSQFWHLPAHVEQRFQNAGNVHLVPRGTVEVRDPAGRVVERAAINDGSNVILPESFRRYKTQLLQLSVAALPGRYTLVSTYRYDGTDVTHMLVTGFWYAGQAFVWGVIAVAVLAVLTLAGWLWWRRRKSLP